MTELRDGAVLVVPTVRQETARPRSAARAGLLAVGSAALLALGGVVTGALTARLLGPDDRGLYTAVSTMAFALHLLPSVGTSEALALTRRDARPRWWTPLTYLVAAVAGLVVALPMVAYARSLGVEADGALLAGIALLPAVQAVAAIAIYDLTAIGRTTLAAAVRVAPTLVQLPLLVALLGGADIGLGTVLATLVAASAVTAAVAVAAVARRSPRQRRPLGVHVRDWWSVVVRTGSARLFTSVAARLDVLVLPYLVSRVDLGWYVVANALIVVVISLTMSLAPLLLSQRDTRQARRLAVASIRLGVLAAAGLAVAGPVLVPVVYGADFRGAVPLSLLGLVPLVLMVVLEAWTRLLQNHGEHGPAVRASVASVVVLLPLLLALTPVLGAAGAMVARTGSLVAALAVLLATSGRRRDLLATLRP